MCARQKCIWVIIAILCLDLSQPFLVEVDDNAKVNNHGGEEKVRKQVSGNDYFFNRVPSWMEHLRTKIHKYVPMSSVLRMRTPSAPETNQIKGTKKFW